MPYPGSFTKITSKGVEGALFKALETQSGLPWVDAISFFNDRSNEATESYAFLGDVPAFREWNGPRLGKQLRENDFSVTNRPFESTIRIAKKDVQRDKTGQINIRLNELSQTPAIHWASKLSTEISENNTAYDATALFGSHENGDSGVLNNDATATEIPALDVATAATPTAVEMSDILLETAGYFRTFNSDNGEPINETASSFLVMCPTVSIWAAARKAVDQDQLNSGETNIIADNSDMNFTVVLNTRLSALTTTMWMFRTDGAVKPLLRQQEGGLEVTSLAEGSDLEHTDRVWEFGIAADRQTAPARFEYAVRMALS